jgi:hypothetical protein
MGNNLVSKWCLSVCLSFENVKMKVMVSCKCCGNFEFIQPSVKSVIELNVIVKGYGCQNLIF